ncbi:hypothetical protein BD626DRAFT_578727 [Schizophyllum amplum]|uniref:Uncharacterized protein n=1 Tax=Schizophyllum amplum TaxID=97359 RepID=A0A550BRS9_9AGAR|nr:hypothetical protein BD626DRAFT_578727 [Auriculariopsis ampla]
MPRSAKSGPKAPPGRRSIFSDAQLEYLRQFLDAYKSPSHGRIRGEAFWNQVIPPYFDKWPLAEPSVDYADCETDAARKAKLDAAKKAQMQGARDQIKGWFTRQTQVHNKPAVWRKHVIHATRPKKGKPRKFTDANMYKFYMTMPEYKEKVDAKAREDLGDRTLAPLETMLHWNAAAKELWDDESEEVKIQVQQAASAAHVERLAVWAQTLNSEAMTDKAREDARDNMVGALQPWIEQVLQITGCTTGTFIAGLPPRKGAPKVKLLTVHVGQTTVLKGARGFEDFNEDEYDDFLRAFAHFTSETTDEVFEDGGAPTKDSDVPEADPLDAMLTFENFDEIRLTKEHSAANGNEDDDGDDGAEVPGFETTPPPQVRTISHARPTAASGSGGTSSRRADAASAAAATTAAQSRAPPTIRSAPTDRAAASDTVSSATRRAVSPTASHASGPAASSIEPALETASATTTQPRRPKPTPRTYDVPEVIDTYLAKQQHLNIHLRGLLQRASEIKRGEYLHYMHRWSSSEISKANRLATEDAELGRSHPTRDAAIFTTLFAHWERAAEPSRMSAKTPPASKRKRTVQEEEEADYRVRGEEDGSEDDEDDVSQLPLRRSACHVQKRAPATSTSKTGAEGRKRKGPVTTPGSPRVGTPPQGDGDEDAAALQRNAVSHAPRDGDVCPPNDEGPRAQADDEASAAHNEAPQAPRSDDAAPGHGQVEEAQRMAAAMLSPGRLGETSTHLENDDAHPTGTDNASTSTKSAAITPEDVEMHDIAPDTEPSEQTTGNSSGLAIFDADTLNSCCCKPLT